MRRGLALGPVAPPALADVGAVIDQQIRPGTSGFATPAPRGGRRHRVERTGAVPGATIRADLCGRTPCPGGFRTTARVLAIKRGQARSPTLHPRAGDPPVRAR